MNGALAPAVRNGGGGGRDRARSRGQRLARSAFPHADRQVVRPVDTHELHVRALGKTRVTLDSRTEPEQLAAFGLATDDSVWIAHRHRREVDSLVTEVERLRLPHFHLSDVQRDVAVRTDHGVEVARPDRDRDALGTRLAREPGCNDANAVAGELGGRAVGVPDTNLGSCPVDGRDLQEPVRPDAVVVVAELPDAVRCQRLGELSLLDQQVVVAERLPLRQFHWRCRPRDDLR